MKGRVGVVQTGNYNEKHKSSLSPLLPLISLILTALYFTYFTYTYQIHVFHILSTIEIPQKTALISPHKTTYKN
jgi:hypothetical protein